MAVLSISDACGDEKGLQIYEQFHAARSVENLPVFSLELTQSHSSPFVEGERIRDDALIYKSREKFNERIQQIQSDKLFEHEYVWNGETSVDVGSQKEPALFPGSGVLYMLDKRPNPNAQISDKLNELSLWGADEGRGASDATYSENEKVLRVRWPNGASFATHFLDDALKTFDKIEFFDSNGKITGSRRFFEWTTVNGVAIPTKGDVLDADGTLLRDFEIKSIAPEVPERTSFELKIPYENSVFIQDNRFPATFRATSLDETLFKKGEYLEACRQAHERGVLHYDKEAEIAELMANLPLTPEQPASDKSTVTNAPANPPLEKLADPNKFTVSSWRKIVVFFGISCVGGILLFVLFWKRFVKYE
jgi:hypothetical protein